jgi:DNA modification methylase
VINASPEIRRVPVKSLKPAPYNPRRIDPAAMAGLEKSLERFGVVEPIIFNQRSGFVVGGHQRLKVLQRMKVAQTDVVVVDLDDTDEKALNLALNNPAITGEFSDKLADLLAEVEQANSTLFADLRLDQLLAEADAKRRKFLAQDDLDEAPAPPAVPVTKLGDVWVLDRHRVVCGDSTDPAVIAALLGDERVDSLVTDPPYGVDYGAKNEFLNEYSKTHRASARGSAGSIARSEKRIANDVDQDYRPWFTSWLRLIPWAEYGTAYVFMSSLILHELRGAIDDAGLTWGDYLLWVKNGQVFGRKDYHSRHEFILYGWPQRHRFYGPVGGRGTVLEYARPSKSELHPTMKPIALLEQLLSDGSPDGSIILDLFGGSGSTLIACEASHRRARLVELDPAYCDVIVERWQALTGGKAVRNGNAP